VNPDDLQLGPLKEVLVAPMHETHPTAAPINSQGGEPDDLQLGTLNPTRRHSSQRNRAHHRHQPGNRHCTRRVGPLGYGAEQT
jgi:hypothetical protein